MLALADHANTESRVAFPSVQRLADRARLSCRQVQRCLRQLEESKELEVSRATGPHGSNVYRITLVTGDILAPMPNCQGDISYRGGDISDMGGVTFTTSTPVQDVTQTIKNRHYTTVIEPRARAPSKNSQVTAEFLSEMVTEFKAVNVDHEYKKCRLWWEEHKSKEPSKLALRNWLEKAIKIAAENRDMEGQKNGQQSEELDPTIADAWKSHHSGTRS